MPCPCTSCSRPSCSWAGASRWRWPTRLAGHRHCELMRHGSYWNWPAKCSLNWCTMMSDEPRRVHRPTARAVDGSLEEACDSYPDASKYKYPYIYRRAYLTIPHTSVAQCSVLSTLSTTSHLSPLTSISHCRQCAVLDQCSPPGSWLALSFHLHQWGPPGALCSLCNA